MTFGQSYLTHMNCLENVSMLRTDTVDFNGTQIVPIQFFKSSSSGSCIFKDLELKEKQISICILQV